MVEKPVAALGLVLLLDFVLSVVMLATDKNLQTNFGASPAYYAHWYGVVVMAIVDLVLGIGALLVTSDSMLGQRTAKLRKVGAAGSLLWSVIAILVMVGIVESYQQVHFPSAGEFAKYLFGTSAYPGALPYIPWLYDLLLVFYVITVVVAGVALMSVRRAGKCSSVPA